MDVVSLGLIVGLEVVLLLGFATVVLWRKHRALYRQLHAAPQPDAADAADGFASIESGYLPYLEKEILANRARLELGEAEDTEDIDIAAALRQRLAVLEAEKKVAESCNDYPERVWQFVAEYFPVAVDAAEEAEDDSDSAWAQAQERIDRLEKFRELFFALKDELEALGNAQQQLGESLSEADLPADLQGQFDALQNHCESLRTQLEQLEDQGEASASSAPMSQPPSPEQVRLNALQDVLGQQSDTLQSMKETVRTATEDSQAEMVAALEKLLHELEQRHLEANTCIEMMQQENERLHNKLETGNLPGEQTEAAANESVVGLESQLGKQQNNIDELHELMEKLQLEADKAQDMQAKLDHFDLSTRDMNMCIQVLEEENVFLQEQIKALLTVEGGGNIYDKTAKEDDKAGLQQELEDLRNQLQDKADKLAALEARYASMEKEYLTLYEASQAS